MKTHSYVLIVALVAAISGILFGYDTGVMSGAILFIAEDFVLTPGVNGIVMGSVLFGALAGAIFSGRATDYFGRRKLLLIVAFIFMFGALGTAIAPSIPLLTIGRIVVGIAIGVASYVGPLYISEMAPQKHRGALVALNQLAITAGILLSYIVDYYFSFTSNWRWMLGFGVIPGILLFLGMLYLPESPRWLLSHGEEEQARKNLLPIRGSEENVEREIANIKVTLKKEAANWKIIFSKLVRPVLWIGFGLAFIQQVTGINTILYYAPTILKMAGFGSASVSILATMGIGAVMFVFTIVSLPLIDRWGRRPLLLAGLIGMGLSLGVLAFLFESSSGIPASMEWTGLVTMLVYIACFSFSLGPIMWLMIAEIYPLQVRGIGASLATCANWCSNLLVTATFLKMVEWIGARGTFSLYAACCLLSIAFVYFLVPETKGASLEMIEENLFAGKPWRELGSELTKVKFR
ncbi:MAG TPA: sugar porter family MFS transporter [Chlamydiales bacterium]|nr:sugar porter family MFS transporter [Chlamydiales bacterium]